MSNAQPIADFLRLKREYDTLTLLGKGPSLDKYDPDNHAEGYVLGLNEVPLVLPCHYGFYLDRSLRVLNYPKHVVTFRHAANRSEHEGRGFYFTPWNMDQLTGEPSELPRFGSGSGTFALALMGEWGIKRVIFWGFDCMLHPLAGCPRNGKAVYANCVKDVCQFNTCSWTYDAVARGTRNVIRHYKFWVEFHHA